MRGYNDRARYAATRRYSHGDPMTSRRCRFAGVMIPLVISGSPLGAQAVGRIDAGGGAGGSVFGWQPKVRVDGALQAASLGDFALTWQGALDRVSGPSNPSVALFTGARLSMRSVDHGW